MDKSPDAFRTISEVADHLDTPAHVLRFWESRFPQIRPVKRAGGRRYYRPSDVALLGGIKRLLHDDGMTIRGVQKVLRDHGVRHVQALSGETLSELPDPAAPVELAMPVPAAPALAEIIPFAQLAGPAAPLSEDPAPQTEAAEAEPEPAPETEDGTAEEGAAVDAVADEAEAAPSEEDSLPLPEPQATAEDPQVPLPPADTGPATLPFLQPRPTPAPPLPELPLFTAPVAPVRPPPANLSELRERLRALAPGSLAHSRDAVVALSRRLQALLPDGAPDDAPDDAPDNAA